MSTTFRPYHPNQDFLLPPSPRDWLPEEHLSHFISDTISQLDLKAFYARYEGDGRRNRPYDPEMMVKVLLYGYATGCFSSRKLAKRIEEDIAFRCLAGGCFPAHRTLCDFRHDHLEAFRALFVQVVQVAKEAGLVKLGTVAIDGTKVKANASRHKSMTYICMEKQEKRLLSEIDKLLDAVNAIDEEEDLLHGVDLRGDELPEGLRRREDRLQQIQEAKKRLEDRQAEADRASGRTADDDRNRGKMGRNYKRDFGVPDPKLQGNFTDPESRIMKGSKGYDQSYNAQISVTGGARIIVATGLTQNASDQDQLLSMIQRTEQVTESLPEKVLADAGYKSEKNLEGLEKAGVDGYVSLGRETKEPKLPGAHHPCSQRMLNKLNSDHGRAHYRKRKGIVEPAVGWVKNVLGFRQFSFRGVKKVTAEWDLVCMAVNLRRMNDQMAWE